MIADPDSGGHIRQLRQRLVVARRRRQGEAVREIIDGLRELGGRGYRCCLIDYERFRTTCYVRILGFEKGRIKVQIEYPIQAGVRRVQWLPLSHLADYDETEPESLREIYRDLGEYLKCRNASLDVQRPRPCGGPALRQRRRHLARDATPVASTVWWGIAGVLFSGSLMLFIVTT